MRRHLHQNFSKNPLLNPLQNRMRRLNGPAAAVPLRNRCESYKTPQNGLKSGKAAVGRHRDNRPDPHSRRTGGTRSIPKTFSNMLLFPAAEKSRNGPATKNPISRQRPSRRGFSRWLRVRRCSGSGERTELRESRRRNAGESYVRTNPGQRRTHSRAQISRAGRCACLFCRKAQKRRADNSVSGTATSPFLPLRPQTREEE